MHFDFPKTKRPQLRHSGNTNLHLYDLPTYDGMPVMLPAGPFIREYLFRLKQTIDLALDQHSRVLAFRVDLRLPLGIDLPDYAYTNEVISRFIDSFKAKIEHNRAKSRERNPYAHDSKVRYVWAREIGERGRPHYHLLILLNQEAYYTVGWLKSKASNINNRMKEAWASALGLSVDEVRGLVNIPPNAEYRIVRNVRSGDVDELPALFYRASYLCKAATKSYGDHQRGFDTSRG
jgi:hypothetical protein